MNGIELEKLKGFLIITGLPGSGIGSYEMWLISSLVYNGKRLLYTTYGHDEMKHRAFPKLKYMEFKLDYSADTLFQESTICTLPIHKETNVDDYLSELINLGTSYSAVNEEEIYLILYNIDKPLERNKLLPLLITAKKSLLKIILFSRTPSNISKEIIELYDTWICFRHNYPPVVDLVGEHMRMNDDDSKNMVNALKNGEYLIYNDELKCFQKNSIEIWHG